MRPIKYSLAACSPLAHGALYHPRPFSSMSFEGSFISEVPLSAGAGRIASCGVARRRLPGVRVSSAQIREVAQGSGPSISASRSRTATKDSPDRRHRRDLRETRFIEALMLPSGAEGLWRARDRGLKVYSRL